ncbi:MAG: NarK family nitrate/nitrite MFS transporter [Thermoanaerobaculia bacterium]
MTEYVLKVWQPEVREFWEARGEAIARRNLWISIPALFLAFAVWMVWSIVVVKLSSAGFAFTTGQLFLLAALPGLSGATLRIFYSFIVPIFGGRRWTAVSTALLLLPAMGIGLAVQSPATPYWVFVTIALLCGLGGGNFASSMANISFFFPKASKGTALGLNAGLGNLGVSGAQFLAPLAITFGVFGAFGGAPQMANVESGRAASIWLQNAGFIWVPLIVVSAFAAWFGMNDLATARASFSEQAVIFRRKHNWLMCWLYLGTFGSFIGFSAGLPLLISSQFPSVDAMKFAFIGPLVGALARPVGGVLADRLGGAPVTFWNFVIMALVTGAAILALPGDGAAGNFPLFLASFIVLFVLTGIGNASTFRMIPVIFLGEHRRLAAGRGAAAAEEAERAASMEAAAVLGFSSAVAAYGAFFIPKSFGTSISATGGAAPALWGFMAFYATCIAITWWFYHRRNAADRC